MVALQSFLSYNKNIPIRIEFATQAMFYFLTIIMMVAASYYLLRTIKSIFGIKNHSFKNEVNQVRVALLIFAVCYTIRVIRNTLVVIYWTPCFTVHRDLTTNFVNTLFYLISDWFAILAMLSVHHNNYKERPADDRSKTNSVSAILSPPSSSYVSISTNRRNSEILSNKAEYEEIEKIEYVDFDAIARLRQSVQV